MKYEWNKLYYSQISMEKQNECPTNFDVKQMYDMRERNYHWESFKYVLPKKYSHHPTNNVPSGAIFGRKKNYLDDLQREKKLLPGPSHYQAKEVLSRPKSGKMDKGQRKTFSEEIRSKSCKQNMPGPANYFKRPKSALNSPSPSSSSYNSLAEAKKNKKEHYLNEVQYLASCSPGVGQYNIGQLNHVKGPKLMKRASMNMKKQRIEKKPSIQGAAIVEGTFDWLSRKQKKKNSHYFSSSKRFVTGSKFEKKPAPNSYSLNTDWTSKENLTKVSNANLATCHKSVYYH